jgi:hypothetical protein
MSTGTTWAPPCPPLAAPIGLGAGISHASFPPYGTEYSHASGYSSIRVLADPTRRNQGGEGETTVNVVGILRCRCAGTPGFRRSYSLRNAEAGVCHSQSSSHRIAQLGVATVSGGRHREGHRGGVMGCGQAQRHSDRGGQEPLLELESEPHRKPMAHSAKRPRRRHSGSSGSSGHAMMISACFLCRRAICTGTEFFPALSGSVVHSLQRDHY